MSSGTKGSAWAEKSRGKWRARYRTLDGDVHSAGTHVTRQAAVQAAYAALERSRIPDRPDPAVMAERGQRVISLGQDDGMAQTEVTITLTGEEALVLFDVLHRWEDEQRVTSVQHRAEQVALWNLSALLERQLVQPFDSRYAEFVAQARERLTPSE